MNDFEAAVKGIQQLLVYNAIIIWFAKEGFDAVLASDYKAFVPEVNGTAFGFTGAWVVVSPAFQIVAKAYTFLVKVVKEDCLLTSIPIKPFILGLVKQRIAIVLPDFARFTDT